MVKQPQFVITQLSSLFTHRDKYSSQDPLAILPSDHQLLWQEVIVNDVPQVEKHDQHEIDFLGPTSKPSTNNSGTWFPRRTQKFMSHHQ